MTPLPLKIAWITERNVYLHYMFIYCLFIYLHQQVVFGCMDLNIRARDGTLKCVQCDECKAGYEPYPACHTDEIFDEVGLVKMCIECKADFFKQVHEGKPNTLMCKPCATVKCRDNYVVLQNCTRSSPPVCSNRCMIGFAKDAFGNCIKVYLLYIVHFYHFCHFNY